MALLQVASLELLPAARLSDWFCEIALVHSLRELYLTRDRAANNWLMETAGTLLTVTLSTLVFPRIGSQAAVASFRDLMQCVCELAEHAWDVLELQVLPLALSHTPCVCKGYALQI